MFYATAAVSWHLMVDDKLANTRTLNFTFKP